MATAIRQDQEPNDRVVIGNNEPPLEDRVLIAFDEGLNEHEGLIARIEQMAVKAAEAKPCTSDESAGRMGDFIRMTATAVKTIEAEREVHNRPLLTAQRALKARADQYALKAANAGTTVRAHLDKWLSDEAARKAKEAARLAEIERQAEAARQALIDEANRKAAAEAEAERARLQAIADAKAEVARAAAQLVEDARVAAEKERLAAIEAERAAAEQRDAVEVVVEAKVIEVAAEVVVVEAAPVIEYAPIERIATAAPVTRIQGDLGTKVGTTTNWHVKVVNIRQVPDAYLKHPAVIEALEKVIGPLVRAKNGLREIKGCEITSTLGSSIR